MQLQTFMALYPSPRSPKFDIVVSRLQVSLIAWNVKYMLETACCFAVRVWLNAGQYSKNGWWFVMFDLLFTQN